MSDSKRPELVPLPPPSNASRPPVVRPPPVRPPAAVQPPPAPRPAAVQPPPAPRPAAMQPPAPGPVAAPPRPAPPTSRAQILAMAAAQAGAPARQPLRPEDFVLPGAAPAPRPAAAAEGERKAVLARFGAAEPDADRSRFEPIHVLADGEAEASLERDVDLGRTVAIRRMRPYQAGADALARFVEEARLLGRLEHPNIAPLHDVGLDADGRLYVVARQSSGESLEEVLRKLRAGDAETLARYTPERRLAIVQDVVRALAAAHAEGVVHRNVAPASVRIGAHGDVVLGEWSSAAPAPAGETTRELDGSDENTRPEAIDGWALMPPEARSRTIRSRTLIGTPAYMSPEQARGQLDRVDARSDLYAATLLLAELMTLRHPLAHCETAEALRAGILAGRRPKATRTRVKGSVLPPDVAHVVRRGLSLDPRGRFQSAAELLALLQQVAEGRAPVQCAGTLTKRVVRGAGRFVDRHPGAATALLAGGALATLAGLGAAVLLALG